MSSEASWDGAPNLLAGAATARAFARAAAVEHQDPVVLTCAVSGGIVTGNPHQPMTRADVIAEAVAAARAGATVVHIHARSASGGMTTSAADFLEIKREVERQAPAVLINFSGSGERAPVQRPGYLGTAPALATVPCGSIDVGSSHLALLNHPTAIADLACEIVRHGITPEYECFDLDMAATAARLAGSSEAVPGMIHLIVGLEGMAPADPDVIALFARMVPAGVPWAATSIRNHLPMMALTLAMGGNIRTGLEDVVFMAPGEYARSNAELVERARALCEAVGRPVATAAEAREILGVRGSSSTENASASRPRAQDPHRSSDAGPEGVSRPSRARAQQTQRAVAGIVRKPVP